MLFHGLADVTQEDGLLARYPGAALLVNGEGRVIAVNLAGAPLADIIAAGRARDFTDLISACIRQNAARNEDVFLSSSEGGKTMEAAVLPTGDGVSALVLCRDVTVERSLRAALSESRQRYKDMVDIAGDFAWETGSDGNFAFISPRGALGYAAAELVGHSPGELVAQTPGRAEPNDQPFTTREMVENIQVWAYRHDHAMACLSTSAVPIYNTDGAWVGARGICRDVTDALTRDAALASANTRERLLSHILRTVRDEIEPADMLAAAAAATARAFNADACLVFRGRDTASFKSAASFGAVVGKAEDVAALLAQVVETTDPTAQAGWLVAATYCRRVINGAVALWRAGGERAWSSDDLALLAGVADHLGIAVAQIANHEQLRDLSRTDGLTGLLNRRTFYAELERRWPRACRAGSGALIYCDLDNFKLVNDHFGHANGDETLCRMAEMLAGTTRGRDLVARLGGDEFALWLEDADMPGAQRKAEGLLTAAAALANLTGDSSRPLGISLGIALPDPHSGTEERLEAFLARADGAMYTAKRTGKGRIVLADPAPRKSEP
jgi:diguanylate cyclase (GGDEF)-like protein/PAS domain S-box-containing protein